jgi:hypothetical protein
MDQSTEVRQNSPVENKLRSLLRAIGIGVLVLILWSVDKIAVRRLPQGSAWRYIIGAVIISVGLATVISLIDRLNIRNT